ncbi:uracil-DNA glycosylase family protein [Rathayibacter sp. Leaf248]|uniref:uracil-DNA glycosylase family protein n=1 Tax=Rathayibacter sp. Leaf248 TaxID=2876555 RepID=UPI001E310677|nr:uracil-DNA glycosylase family protein [Rathayibacter sp. Leaf248]
MSELIGYQVRENWMGTEVLTLADVWPETPRAMVVGLNPAPSSVAAGHYYQGQVGQRQLRRLAGAGLFSLPADSFYETGALASDVGFTDVVKRPTRGEADLPQNEIEFGSNVLAAKLSVSGVPLVVCVFRHPVRVLLGTEGTPGLQARRTSWGASVFRMPGPFDARENVSQLMSELSDLLAR